MTASIVNRARVGAVACAWLLALGCGDDGNGAAEADDSDGTSEESEQPQDAKYAVSSVVTAMGAQTGYVTILDSLNPSKSDVSLAAANEFAGLADMWVYEGSLFVSGGDAPTVTKFSIDAKGELREGREVSFMRYGLTDTAFWNNTFVSATKAYMANAERELIVWNPTTMELDSKIAIDGLDERSGFVVRLGSSDRSAVVHENRLFIPAYWTDADYADRTDDSRIIVFDTKKDEVVEVLEAPCPGLDVGTKDEDGNLYFSNWTGGAGTNLVLGTASTCVVKVVAKTLAVSKELEFAEVAGGRQGAAFNYAGNGRFVMSIFHDENVADLESEKDPFALIGTENWKVWSYDAATKKAKELDSIPGNSGAIYWFSVDGTAKALVPTADYAAANIYDLGKGDDAAEKLFQIQGFGIRLFRIR